MRSEYYPVLRDCDDRQGWMASEDREPFYKTIYNSMTVGSSTERGTCEWHFDANGRVIGFGEVGDAGVGVSGTRTFTHDGRCTCFVTSHVDEREVFLMDFVVVPCSGGAEHHNHIVEIIFGDVIGI
jgi:hypothetical protein